tara:strand:- start:261 stop:812 length:552 start_codon:yes stop_codon:yes gene_type:complete
MAGQRLTDKSALVTTPGTGDLFMVVDVNDTTGSAAGTSKKIDNKFIVQTDKITISNAEFLALNSDGRTLISSPGAGFAIMPMIVYIEQVEGGTPNEASIGLTCGHKNKDASYYWSSARFWPDDPSNNGYAYILQGNDNSSKGIMEAEGIADKGLYLYARSAAPDGGSTNTMIAWVTYRIIDIS